MKSSLLVAFAFGVGVLTVCGPALAHHGNAVYEAQWTEFEEVTVTRFPRWTAENRQLIDRAKPAISAG